MLPRIIVDTTFLFSTITVSCILLIFSRHSCSVSFQDPFGFACFFALILFGGLFCFAFVPGTGTLVPHFLP